jgi:quercetin dioxygenase-like cupin family protein
MNTFTHHRLAAVVVAGLAASLGPVAATAAPPSTEPPIPPIAAEELTRIDEDTLARGNFTDGVTATLRLTYEGLDEVSMDLETLSHIAVARITVQPGAQFPWHTHPGPVIVNVTHGELVYVRADDCVQRPYPAGTAFVDPGRGTVHTALNPGDVETVFVATFTEVTADGPLSITEGITTPADNCALPATTAPHGSHGASS